MGNPKDIHCSFSENKKIQKLTRYENHGSHSETSNFFPTATSFQKWKHCMNYTSSQPRIAKEKSKILFHSNIHIDKTISLWIGAFLRIGVCKSFFLFFCFPFQIMWARTTSVGCFYRICQSPENKKDVVFFLMCLYHPKGNVDGESVFDNHAFQRLAIYRDRVGTCDS